MYPLHDKDLDRLSRNAAEHYEMDFGPSGWEQLEKRLDQELPQDKGKRRRFLFWLFFIVVTTGSALTGLLINSQPVTPLASRSIRAMAPVQESPATLDDRATTPAGAAEATNDPVNTTTTETTPSTGHNNKQAEARNNIDNNKPPLPGQPGSVAGDETTPGNRTQGTTPPARADKGTQNMTHDGFTSIPNSAGAKGKGRKIHSAWPRPVTDANAPNALVKKQSAGGNRKNNPKPQSPGKNDLNDNEPATTAQPITDNNTTTQTPPPTTTVTDQPATIQASDSAKTPEVVTGPKAPKQQKGPQRGFEFSIVTGPDGTTVASGPFYKTGYNVGVQIGYRFNDRWSVNTGVIYTKKRYEADSTSFNPKDPWFHYINLLDLTGSCAMFDIPVNVRFDVSYNDKRRFFVSTGLSTYIMDKQDYWYRYASRNNPTSYNRDTVYTKNEKYPFSILNLSLGYERMLGKHFSIQAEPYLKLPLKGLGYGHMRMNSYGMFLSLKYRVAQGSRK